MMPCDNHRACRGAAAVRLLSRYHECWLWLCHGCVEGYERDFGERQVAGKEAVE